jgi:hypothetical protein
MSRTYRRQNYSVIKSHVPDLDKFLERREFYTRYFGATKTNPKEAIKQISNRFHSDKDWYRSPPAWFRREYEQNYRSENHQKLRNFILKGDLEDGDALLIPFKKSIRYDWF